MLFITIWPIFGLICLGFGLMWINFPGTGFWPAAERINYFILFPALLVSSLVDAPIMDPAIMRLGGAAVATICVAAIGLFISREFRTVPAARFGPAFQGVVRFNTYLGLAIISSLAGTEGLGRAAVLLAVAVPLVNVLSIVALTDAGVARAPMALLRKIVLNPLILACMVGITLALTGTSLPFGLKEFFDLLAQGSLPLGLLCVGAALRPKTMRQDLAALAGNGAVRLLAMPALAALVGAGFKLNGTEALVLVVFSAIPTAPTAYVLTQQLNGDGRFMAGLITSQTLAAVVTIPFVFFILGYG